MVSPSDTVGQLSGVEPAAGAAKVIEHGWSRSLAAKDRSRLLQRSGWAVMNFPPSLSKYWQNISINFAYSKATLRQVATLAAGSSFAMSFMLPIEMNEPDIRIGVERAAAGTPFISFFMPAEMMAMSREAGFKKVEHISAATLAQRYFANRSDGLRPPNNSEELLIATT